MQEVAPEESLAPQAVEWVDLPCSVVEKSLFHLIEIQLDLSKHIFNISYSFGFGRPPTGGPARQGGPISQGFADNSSVNRMKDRDNSLDNS